MPSLKTKATGSLGKLACILLLCSAFGSCATRPPVVVIAPPPDVNLIVPLSFCPPAETIGVLEDCLVKFVHETLPLDNQRKVELLKQIKAQGR